MRIVLLILLLAVASPRVHAQDDDGGLLETPPLEGIPERMEALEREWNDDVGVKEPVDDASDERDPEAAEPADPLHDDEPEPVKAPPADAPRPEWPSTVRRPDGDTGGRKAPGRTSSDGMPAKAPGSGPARAERRATPEE